MMQAVTPHDAETPNGSRRDWLERALAAWTSYWARRRVLLGMMLVLLGAAFSWLSRSVQWQPDVLAFFSARSADVQSARLAAGQPGLGNQLRFDVHPAAGGAPEHRDEEVRAAARSLGALLAQSGLFRSVWSGIEPAELAACYGRLATQGPALLTEGEQASVEQGATRAALSARFAEVRQHLADPDGALRLRQLAADPLDLAAAVSRKASDMRLLASSAPLEDGMLVARDSLGLHVMLVAEPQALPSDQRGTEQLMAAVDRATARLREAGMEVWVVGAHRAYLENARQVVRDVTLVGVLGTLLVALAIAAYFRRLASVLVCMLPPTLGVGMALGVAGAAGVELPLILLGFAGLLCGSTTDYGIQIIAELRRLITGAGGWRPELAARAARRMLGPISMSVATSITGFAALGLSTAPGLRALGLFVAGATVCIWLVTFLILPVCLGPWAERQPHAPRFRVPAKAAWWCAAVAFAAVTLWLGRHGMHVRFNMDPHGLDGSSAELRAEEAAFYRVWGDLANRAIVLVNEPTADAALRELAQVNDYLQDQRRDGLIAGIISPAGILPDDATVAARVEAWRDYWTAARRAELHGELAAAARANGFSSEALAAYADRVGAFAPETAVARVHDSPLALFPGLLQDSARGVTLATIVAMRGDRPLRLATGWGPELRTRFPDITILSGDLLVFDALERARAEGERLAPWCVLAILAPLWLYLRRLRRAWLAMVCLVVGLVWVLGVAQTAGGGLNLLSLVPVLFTLGVAVDYGIYAVTDPAWTTGQSGAANRQGATFLCALTTILGAGSLMVAGHPALRWLGMTLAAGIAGGYLASVFIVAGALRLRPRRAAETGGIRKVARGISRWMARLAVAALTLALLVPPATEWALARERPPLLPQGPWTPPAVEQIGRRTRSTGASWMRWQPAQPDTGLWELMLAGDPRQRGYAAAKLGGPLDVRIENEMLEQLDTFLPDEWSRWLVVRGMETNLLELQDFVPPEYQQELYWTAFYHRDPHDYLGPMYPRLLAYHALHDISQMLIDNPLIVPNTFACTGVVSLPDYSAHDGAGHLYLARVFDFEGGESFGRQKSITCVVPPPGQGIPFAHVAWPGLAGVVTGMNREKIAVFLNAAATSDVRRIGTPTILMAREILERARSIAEAEAIIRATPVFVSDIIVVADGKTGQARVFEKSPRRVAAYTVRHSAVVTNHLITDTFKDDPANRSRRAESTSLQRNMRARQLLDRMAGQVTPERLAALLRDKKGLDDRDLGLGNRNAIDGLIACHAVIMDVTSGRMWVAGWPNAEGEFVGVDVPALLDQGAGNPHVEAPATPDRIAADAILSGGPNGQESAWRKMLAGRAAAKRCAAALTAGKYDEALALADAVVRDNPGFYQGYELRGRALLGQGDRAGAAAAFTEALQRDPPFATRRAALQELIRQCAIR